MAVHVEGKEKRKGRAGAWRVRLTFCDSMDSFKTILRGQINSAAVNDWTHEDSNEINPEGDSEKNSTMETPIPILEYNKVNKKITK